jgi:hypothetical protein
MERKVPIDSQCQGSVAAVLDVVATQCAGGNCMYAYNFVDGGNTVVLKFKVCGQNISSAPATPESNPGA